MRTYSAKGCRNINIIKIKIAIPKKLPYIKIGSPSYNSKQTGKKVIKKPKKSLFNIVIINIEKGKEIQKSPKKQIYIEKDLSGAQEVSHTNYTNNRTKENNIYIIQTENNIEMG